MNNSIIQALEDQLGCYKRLAKLAELQHIHVQQSQTESLISVLKNRQLVLDEITVLERQVGPIKRNWMDFAVTLETSMRQKAESFLTETRRLLEQITTSDQNDAMILQQRKLNLGKQINQASSAGRVNRTYAAAAYGTPKARMDLQR